MSTSSKSKEKNDKNTKTTQKLGLQSIVFRAITIIFILVVIVFVMDSFFLHTGKLKRNIYLGEKNVSGLDKEYFYTYINSIKKDIQDKELVLEKEHTKSIITAEQIGFNLDEDKLWENAYKIGREINLLDRFVLWIQSFYTDTQLPYTSFLVDDDFDYYLKLLSQDINLKKVFEGSVEIRGFDVVSELPRNGESIDREKLLSLIMDGFVSKNKNDKITIPTKTVLSQRDPHVIEDFSEKVIAMIEKPLVLANTKFEDISLTLSNQDLIDILHISISQDPSIEPHISIDDIQLAEKLIILKAQDAKFIVNDDYSVTVLPGRNGAQVDLEKTKQNIMEELNKEQKGIVHIAIEDFFVPNFSDTEANRLGIKHVVSEFTTHYGCCVARAENIQRISDLIDNTIIKSGESFNVNTFIGERTEEKGFKNAGSIWKGEMVDSVGGGISQFITTFHNALYWGGYEIIKHKPHSIYFSRYPHGIDATINWPYVDYIFKNDTEHAVVIDTEYTDTSITVRILGNNDGRIITGDHTYWSTPMVIKNKGGEQSRRIISSVLDSFDFKDPVVRYVSDESVARGSKPIFVKRGKDGWKTIVDRKIYISDELYRQDVWPVYYESGKETIYKVHPCDNYFEEDKPSYCLLEN